MKWHYICEDKDCELKCEILTANTISSDRGCPNAKWGKVADWGNLGLVKSPSGIKIFRICEHCNKEFELPDLSVTVHAECPHCHKSNDIWIRLS